MALSGICCPCIWMQVIDIQFSTCKDRICVEVSAGGNSLSMSERKPKYTHHCCGLNGFFRMSKLSPPKEVQDLFHKYAENNVIGATQLHRFLVDMQGEKEATQKHAEDIIAAQLRESNLIYHHSFNRRSFLHFLLNPRLNPPIRTEVHHDMKKPLSHYYIFTGHNSYLTGNQLYSDCSEKPIIKSLKRGVRVVELDLWPNSRNDNVQVRHGKTLTAPVDFQTCISAIKDHAFVASEYPVVITLEDHLSPALQAKVAEIITETLGDILYCPPADETFKEFPSPETLKKRILISTKPPKEYVGAVAPIEGPVPTQEEAWGDDIPDYNEQLEHVAEMGAPPAAPDDDEGKKAAPEYKRIIAIRQSEKPKGGSLKDTLAAVDDGVERRSLSEPQLEKLCKKYPTTVIKYTSRNILRVYPYGLRVSSSNYSPLLAWTHGAQMVALNMQGYGRPLWLAHGFFKANGGCGYVKKPDFLLPSKTGGPAFDPRRRLPVKTTLKVKVYMGLGWLEKFGKRHFDKYSPPDFYTRVGIAGVPADQKMERTSTSENDWHPKWDKEFKFPLTVPELAVLRVEVHEYNMPERDDFGGQICLPVSELKTGIRSVTLCDKRGDELTGVKLLLGFLL